MTTAREVVVYTQGAWPFHAASEIAQPQCRRWAALAPTQRRLLPGASRDPPTWRYTSADSPQKAIADWWLSPDRTERVRVYAVNVHAVPGHTDRLVAQLFDSDNRMFITLDITIVPRKKGKGKRK